jgi:hypothetical protein
MKLLMGSEEEFIFIYNSLAKCPIHGVDSKRMASILLKIEQVLQVGGPAEEAGDDSVESEES